MSKRIFKVLPLAGAVSAAVFSAAASAAVENIDFHGYVRSGIGASSDGGDQAAFQAAGAGTKYRLGNETETYGEIGIGSELFNNGEQSFYLDTMMAYGVDQAEGWEGTEPGVVQFNVQGKGVLGFAPEATLWAGKRYYKRHDVHMSDFYYWNVSGPGAGIENINVGFADFSIAWVKSSTEFEYYNSAEDATADNVTAEAQSLDQNILDFRLENIRTNPNGALTLGLNYAEGNPFDGFEGFDSDGNSFGDSELDDSGYMFTAEHTQSEFFGGFNKFVVQYAADAMTASGLGTNGQGVSAINGNNFDGNEFLRILNHGVIGIGQNIEMQYQASYNSLSFEESGKDDETWISVGVRPVYFWNDIMSTAVEVGYDYVKDANVTDLDNNDQVIDSKLGKITVAQQWSAGRGYWARPQIRAFATYAKWNDESKGYVGRGTAFEDQTDGYTFGVQMEAWW